MLSSHEILQSVCILNLFTANCAKTAIGDIDREDLLNHMSFLAGEGMMPRAIYNHIARIDTLLRANEITRLLNSQDKPRYEERAPDAYNADQISALLAEANAEERILFEFFPGTGLRALHLNPEQFLEAKLTACCL